MAYSSEKSMETFICSYLLCVIIGIILVFLTGEDKYIILGFVGLPIAMFVMFLRDLVGDNQIT